MFRENKSHRQPPLLSHVASLTEKQRERLEDSWAGVFYPEFFCRMNEEQLAVLYGENPSRPNVAVNLLLGLEALKSGFGWSDEELYDHFCFDLQVRYALGIHDLNTEHFELRTLYNFRRRLSQYNLKHGVNLVAQVFASITDEQLAAFKLGTKMQRMDSTQIAGNIFNASRLHLLVEAVQRLNRLLTPEERVTHAVLLAPLTSRSCEQVVAQMPGRRATYEQLQGIGETLDTLLTLLEPRHAQNPIYAVVTRLFQENFHRSTRPVTQSEERVIQTKPNEEVTSDCLLSLDDLEATFHRKGDKGYRGYVANLTQTCDPGNALQLITHVQVAPNNVQDVTLLVEALPDLTTRTELETLYTDAGFGSPTADIPLHKEHITQIQTGIKGKAPAPDKFSLSDFDVVQNSDGTPIQITCPAQQTVAVLPARSATGFVARFAKDLCSACPLAARCRVVPARRAPYATYPFTQKQLFSALRRKLFLAHQQDKRNLRVAIEATIRSLKHPFRHGKVPVRGRFRTTCLLVLSAAMSNLRSIYRYLNPPPPKAAAT